jgi:hypothetical protein
MRDQTGSEVGPPTAGGERLAHWALYWGVAINAAVAPAIALLFAPVTSMSGRTDLIVGWSSLSRLFPITHRIFAVMLGAALVGLVMGVISLVGTPRERRPAPPNRFTHDAVVAMILGVLGLLLWGTLLALSLQLATVYRAWGVSLGLR